MPFCAISNLRSVIHVALGLLVGIAVTPGRAAACSCGAYLAATRWPEQGARDVPLDTPIVLARMNHQGSNDDIRYALRDAAGQAVPLIEQSRIQPAYPGCGAAELLFLRPKRALEPDATYEIAFDVSTLQGESDLPIEAVQFHTGQTRAGAWPALSASQRYLELQSSRCSAGVCPAMAQVRVELSAQPQTPVWAVLHSFAPKYATEVLQLRPDNVTRSAREVASAPAWTLGVKRADGDACVELHIIGVTGASVYDWTSCEPNACAITARWGSDSCGGPPKSAIDTLQLDDGSCANPPDLDNDGDVAGDAPDGGATPGMSNASDPDSDAGERTHRNADAAPAERGDSSCNVSARGSGGGAERALALLGVAFAMLRRRRMQDQF